MLHTTIVTNTEELQQVYQLNLDNLKQNLSAQERQKEGFVTWLYSLQLLQQMQGLAPSVIVKDDDLVIGYALTTLKESAIFHKDLGAMFDNLEQLSYNDERIFSCNFYCMGQICIHKKYRGRGVFAMLYRKHKEIYSQRFDMLITEVSSSNIRSQKAHESVGFKTIDTYSDQLDEWNVVVWDWRQP